MIKLASKFTIQTFGLVFSAGMLLLPVAGQAGQGMGSTSGSSDSVPEVQSQLESGSDTQWSDQLQRERDQAKQSRDQAQQERDQAQQERDLALQAGKGSDDSGSGMKSIQGQTSSARNGSGAENQENARLIQDRDQYLKERDALQKETSDLRQERDRAMSSISGGSALDAVDRGMPVTPGH
ncbi:hypothetical protein [Candidatus Nitrospira neomarina]|uniref:Uncharacterized protein n=1 Tax=Candidatus Nitrospira neomarina TaxID=3020899 RepID=A0AA96JWJ9_9BACT|nr:hypothetical protein [Candidatus Nitrospira neomarina]WNM62608.1 hypothetical protein PQG83_02350 [Candidatus Nitrospira neomarina]